MTASYRLPIATVVLGALWWATSSAAARQSAAGPPSRVPEALNRFIRLTSTEQARLIRGEPVTRVLDADPSREVAVYGAIWVAAPMARYVAAVKDIEQFEKGDNFLITKKISRPPKLEDFAAMHLPPDDFEDLKDCRVGDCELKLSEAALARIRREIDWSKPTAAADVDRLMQRLAFEYVTGYLEGGNTRLATYRDADRPTFVGHEFASMVGRAPSLTHLPELKRYLLEFPRVTLPNSESFLYWQEARFGLKPTVRINHLTTIVEPDQVVVASKMLYASHYFWTAIELRVLMRDATRGDGFWFASVNRSRSDGLSGFVGTLIRGKVRSEAEKGMQAVLSTTKSRMEQR
jgi:hypothetical protein